VRGKVSRAEDRRSRSTAQHSPQHVLHDPAVAVVVGLAGGVDADHRVELDRRAALTGLPKIMSTRALESGG
jgi:hypothetical protein